MRIVFFGCDDFAAVHLKRLISDGHALAALVTQPDRPRGRGLHIVFSPTKEIAIQAGIEVFQPVGLKNEDVLRQLKSYGADVFVVVAYGKLLPEEVLSIPKYFCVNVHPSLLPKYRGAAPINWAVINGEPETGLTLIRMDASMDGGDILAQRTVPLPEEMTSATLREQLGLLGADMLAGLLPLISTGKFTLTQQEGARASHAPKMHKDLGVIRWTDSAKKIHDLVRGAQPWPGAFTFFKGGLLKILEAAPCVSVVSARPGQIMELHKDGFVVQAGDGAVLVKRVHPAGGKPMDARSFCAGHKAIIGETLA